MGEKRFLIVAGTSDYPRLPEDFRRLKRIPEHVDEVGRLFQARGYARCLPAISLNPSSAALKQGLSSWFRSKDRTEADRVVFYYTGHGVYADDRTHFLATHDTVLDQLEVTAVQTRELARLMLLGSPVRRLLIILDTCYSSGGAHAVATEAMRVDAGGTKELWVLASAQPKAEAEQGVFVRALADAAGSERWHGTIHRFVQLPLLVRAVNGGLQAQNAPQRARLDAVSAEGGEFIPNINFVDGDLHALIAATEREEERTHWDPKARGVEGPNQGGWCFEGRRAALSELTAWLTKEPHDGRPRVVTGDAGSGKSSVLARLALLADPVQRRRLPPAQLNEGTLQLERVIDCKIHARSKTTAQILERVALTAAVEATTTGALIDGLEVTRSSRVKPLTIIVDAIDESLEPTALITGLLVPLSIRTEIRLLVGTRRELVPLFGPHVKTLDLDTDDYFKAEDMRRFVSELLLARDDPRSRSPYRRVDEAERAALAIAEAARHVFLVARLVAQTLILDDAPADLRFVTLPDDIPTAFEFYLSRFRNDQQRVRDLIRPLGYAQGQGLPWRDLWANLASEVSGRPYTDRDIEWVLRHAGAFIVEIAEQSGSVYRLYHEGLAEHVRETAAPSARIHRTFVDALTASAGHDWSDPYTRLHLATHAAAAGNGALDALIQDVGYLLAADPDALLRVMPTLVSDHAIEVARAFECVAHRTRGLGINDRAAYVEIAAVKCGVGSLADDIRGCYPDRPWSARWANWEQTRHYVFSSRHKGSVDALAFNGIPETPVLVSGGSDGRIRRWDAETGRQIGPPIDAGSAVEAVVVVMRSGRQVIVAGMKDGSPRLWDLESGIPEGVQLNGHVGGVITICAGMSRGRSWVASLGFDDLKQPVKRMGLRIDSRPHSIRVWDVEEGRLIVGPIRNLGASWVFTVGTTADRGFIVTAGDSYINLWDFETTAPVGDRIRGDVNGGPYSVVFVERLGRPTVVTGETGVVSFRDVRDVRRGESVRTMTSMSDYQIHLTLGQFNERSGIVAHALTGVEVFDVETRERMGVTIVHSHVISCAAGNTHGQPVIFTGDADGEIRGWPWRSDAPDARVPGEGCAALAVVNRPSGPIAVAGTWDGDLRAWNMETGQPQEAPIASGVRRMAVGDRGRGTVLAAKDKYGCIHRYDVDTWIEIGSPIHDARIAHDPAIDIVRWKERHVVVTASESLGVQFWDVESGELVDELAGHYTALANHHNARGSILACGRWDGTIEVFDCTTGRAIVPPVSGRQRHIIAIALLEHEGRTLLVSGDGDPRLFGERTSKLCLFDLSSGALVADMDHHASSLAIWAVTFMRVNGVTVIVSGDHDGRLCLSDTSGALLSELHLEAPVRGLGTASSEGLIVGTSDGVIALDVRRLSPMEKHRFS
jgi:WD40 repeat protein